MNGNGSRGHGSSVRLRLALSYAGFLVAAGALVLAIAYLVLRYFPNYPLTAANPSDERGAPSRQQILDALVSNSVVALAILAAIGITGGWFLAGRMLRPLEQISRSAATIAAVGDWNHRVNFEGPNDEFARLADAFDHMLDQLQRSYEAQERFAANASHELRTPLTVTATLLDVARRNPERQDYPALVSRLSAANTHAIDLTEAILRLAAVTGATPAQGTAALHEIVGRSLNVLEEELSARRLRVESNIESVAVEGDATLVGQLVHNLVQNAVRHNIDGGSIRIVCSVEHGSAVLRVENDGRVYDANAVVRFIEPFHRGSGRIREPGQLRGYGLGLAIAERIVEVHGGELGLSPRPEGGLMVWVSLPLTRVS